jgi:hypothetical protein
LYIDYDYRSWQHVERECLDRGGLLVSLETREEEKAVDSALQLVDSEYVYVGLRSTASNTMPSYMRYL